MKITDYFYPEPDRQWEYSSQLGIKYATARMPDSRMEETAGSLELLKALCERYEERGFKVKVIEPAPPNQKIKQGLPGRDEEIERMITLIKNMGKLGIEVLCYNFVAHFNWVRTTFDYPERGGARVSEFDYSKLEDGLTEAGVITKEALWENFAYMQRAIVPAAEEAGVKLALHPDDPPVDQIRGVSRIFTSADALERAMEIAPSPAAGITMCQGCFAAMGEDVVKCIERFGDRIHFVHFRDVAGNKYKFHETYHDNGPTDMAEVIRAYHRIGYHGYGRVDHVPAMAGEVGERPGYANVGRLYAIGYLRGLLEMDRSLEE